jgi:hypothetical protein
LKSGQPHDTRFLDRVSDARAGGGGSGSVAVVDRAILKGVSAAEARVSRGAVESFMSAVDAPTP